MKRRLKQLFDSYLGLSAPARIATSTAVGAWLPTLALSVHDGVKVLHNNWLVLLPATTIALVTMIREAALLRIETPKPQPGEPIVAYRKWTLTQNGTLRSWLNDVAWPVRQPITSDYGLRRHMEMFDPELYEQIRAHNYRIQLPDKDNTVGVYGMKCHQRTPVSLPLLLQPRVALKHGDVKVFGEVNLWGRVAEGAHGYRAEFGYPRRLIGGGRTVRDVAARYGVPYVSHWRWILEGLHGSR